MKPQRAPHLWQLGVLLLVLLALSARATTYYVNQNNPSPVAPYTSWVTAATNIEDAAGEAFSGGTVLVTNGLYQYSGNSLDGSNRVNVLPGVTVQSINGPAFTVIQGYQVPGTTNGLDAIRCAYVNNGAVLSGFTLTNGATPASSSFGYGGGVYCESTSCLVSNCIITGNAAYEGAGGGDSGTFVNCIFSENTVPTFGSGGGVVGSTLTNCLLAVNSANSFGAAVNCTLVNCTVVSNSASVSLGAVHDCALENSIAYYNFYHGTVADVDPSDHATNCCMSITNNILGANNFTNPPGFVNPSGGNYLLQIGSPCIAAGNTAFVSVSNDLDGNPRTVGGAVDLGAYESQYTNVVHYVSLVSTNPVPPYTNWPTAATNIQAAVAVANPGDFVVVSSGIYKIGAVAVYGQAVNCVALTNAITLLGLYGAQVTAIEGSSSPVKRCVYVGSNAVLNGFSLINGNASASGDLIKEESGGGAWCEASGVISNCVFGGNNFPYPVVNNCYALNEGGGVYGGTIYNSTLAYDNADRNGPAAAAANLVNCIIETNPAPNGFVGAAGAIYQCIASNCLITCNVGGASQSTLYNCLVTSNQDSGTVNCTNYNCILTNNSSLGGSGDGGGANGGILTNCILWNNMAAQLGGGAYQSVLYNCAVISNTAPDGGGVYHGTLYNCTVVGNNADNGGGVLDSTLYNSIIYSNNPGNYLGSSFNYCDTTPLPASGTGNITNNPAFINPGAGNYRLPFSSPCIGAGNIAYVSTATDLDGNPRTVAGRVDLGAYQNQNMNHYVSLSSTNPVSPYSGWATAATNIQNAIDAAIPGDDIFVTNGLYNSGGRTVNGYGLTNRVVIDQPVTVQSVNGPGVTWIQGKSPQGSSAIRCVYLTNGAALFGFTLTNGATLNAYGSNSVYELSGGGLLCESTNAVASNCLITASSASDSGGGVEGGTLKACTIMGNSAVDGGGGVSNVLNNCIIAGNTVVNTGSGAGAYGSSLNNCIISSNSTISGYFGGGVFSCILNNCILTSNSVPVGSAGGGAAYSTLTNCLLAANRAGEGGGAFDCLLVNCTVATNFGGGVADYTGSWSYNCVIYDNLIFSGSSPLNYQGGMNFSYCDTTPLPSGPGNITNDPAFVNLAGGNYQLQSSSPCINSGNNANVTSATDLVGNPRIVGGTVDMGAYEYQSPASVISYAYLQYYDLPTDGSVDYADLDGTGFNVYQDWVAGLNPTNPASILAMNTPAATINTNGITVTWQSVTNISYNLLRSTNFLVQPVFTTIQSNIPGQTGTTSYTDTSATNGVPYFYRVSVTAP